MESAYVRRGYLKEDFRLFHLRDNLGDETEYHYHEFDKIVIFISGSASYTIEGMTYPLMPWDILLVSNHTVHRAIIDKSREYERIIIYLSPEFAEKFNTEKTELMRCFAYSQQRRFHLLRPELERQENIKLILRELEDELKSSDFGSDVSSHLALMRLLIQLNRSCDAQAKRETLPSVYVDPKIESVISYINANLDGDLSVETLAAESYMSKYHFMRKFKELTGYTVHSYILQKRLIAAANLIKSGVSSTRAAAISGFRDYSTFQRAFKKAFGVNPVKMK